MLILLSPSKGIDCESEAKTDLSSQPYFLNEARGLVALLSSYSVEALTEFMKLSPKLGELNYQRFQNWEAHEALSNQCLQAGYAFQGDAFQGLEFHSLNVDELTFAQENLRIFSGLYGILKPMDLIAEYRLDIAQPLKVEEKNLYNFWKKKLTDYINTSLSSSGEDTIINLASNEYFKALDNKELRGNVLTPVFLDSKNGKTFKAISSYSKKARGSMARYIIKNKITSYEELKEFSELGYEFSEEESTDKNYVFKRIKA